MTKMQRNFLISFSVFMAFLNAYGLYNNVVYYIKHPQDMIELSMLFFNVVELVYCLYVFFLFRAVKINVFDKMVVYIVGAISILLNFYYLILDYQWVYDFSSVVFWMFYNTLMILFPLMLFHFIYKNKTFI